MGLKTGLLFLQLLGSVHLLLALSDVDGTCSYPGEMLPDTVSCYEFYQCDINLEPVQYTCPSGYCYNKEAKYCDYPANVACCGGGVSTTARPTNNPTSAVVTCSYVGQLIPDPNSCFDYYECDGNLTPERIDCPIGFCYNSQYEYCDYPYNVPCCGGSTSAPSPTGPTEPPPVTCSFSGELLPDPNSCTDFYECNDALIPEKIACQAGFCYNSVAQYCDYPENVPCCGGVLPSSSIAPTGPTQAPPVQCTEIGELIVDPNDCHSFYECDDNLQPIKFTCDEGLCFSTVTNTCDFAVNVPCCAGTSEMSQKSHRRLTPFLYH